MLVSLRHIAACLFLFVLAPAAAFAECASCVRTPPVSHGCHSNCNTSPPPACRNCQPPQIVVPRAYIPAPSISISNASASAQASATSIAIATAQTGDVILRNGGGVDVSVAAGVEGEGFGELIIAAAQTAAMDRTINMSAICIDAQGNPHPASQTFGERDVAETYQGEIFRCIAGTRMRVTKAGSTFDCAAGEALWYENGQATCRTQIVRHPGDEAALLRRYGPGGKMVRIRETATASPAAYSASARATQFGPQMSLTPMALPMQGGVGH